MKRIHTDLSVEAIMLTYNQLERTAYRWKAEGIPLSKYKKLTEEKLSNSTVKNSNLTKSSKNDNVKSTDKIADKIDYLTNKVEHLESLVKSLVLEIRNSKSTDKITDKITDKNIDIIDSNSNKELVINTNKQDSIINIDKLTNSKNDNVNLVNIKKAKSKNTIPAIQEMISAEEFKIFKVEVLDKYPKASTKFRLNAVVQEYMTLSHNEKQELFDDMDKVVSFNKGRNPCHVKNLLSFLKERHWQLIDSSVLNTSQSRNQLNAGSEILRRIQRQCGA